MRKLERTLRLTGNMHNKNLFHVHTYRCGHAAGDTDEMYVKKAIELGAESITFTDHAPFPGNPFGNRMDYEMLPEYVQSLSYLKEQYDGLIKIKIGLEIEYLPGFMNYYEQLNNSKLFDILILGQHFYECKDGIYSFSLKKQEFQMQDAEGLYNAAIEGMKTGYFKVIAHPDRMFRSCEEWNSYMEQMSKEIIDIAKKQNVLLEQNISSMKQGNSYRPEFWEMVLDDKDIIIGLDAHSVDDLGNLWQYTEGI